MGIHARTGPQTPREDRMEALKLAKDVRCTACELLLEHLLTRAESLSEEYYLEPF